MKKIICYGDSNTFGFNPKNGSRYDRETRWTGILAEILADKFVIKEEGCNNRTGFFVNPDGMLQSGQKYLPKCLDKHGNFDIFILALGTNDLQKTFNIEEQIVKEGLNTLTKIIKTANPDARIIIIPPVILDEDVLNGYFNCQFDKKSIHSSIWIQKLYANFAQKENFEFLDLNAFVTPSRIDGLHFDSEAHKIIAEQIANKVLKNNTQANITF